MLKETLDIHLSDRQLLNPYRVHAAGASTNVIGKVSVLMGNRDNKIYNNINLKIIKFIIIKVIICSIIYTIQYII